MLVFIVATAYPNSLNPVANSFVKEQAEALAKNGCEVVVLDVNQLPTKYLFKSINHSIDIHKDGLVSIISLKQKTLSARKLVAINQFFFNKDINKLFKIALNEYGVPDVVYAHFFDAAYAIIKAIKSNNIFVPTVVLEHSGQLMHSKLKAYSARMFQYVANNSDKYLATTLGLKNAIIKEYGKPLEVEIIPNLIDDHFNYSFPIIKERFKYLSVARLDKDKCLDLLICAFCETFSANDNVELRIGGVGEEFVNLSKMIEDYHRQGQIFLLGRLSREEVCDEMANCNCFVLPSRHETFGIVWREALMSGRPVITTNHGGFSSDDWNKDFGVMIPVDDKHALKKALMDVKDNYSLYDFKKISSINSMLYSSSIIAEKLVKIFNSVIEKGNYHEK